MSGLKKKAKQAFNFLTFDVFRSKSKAPSQDKPELAMPDEEAIKREARKRQAKLAARGGRASTILDDDEDMLG